MAATRQKEWHDRALLAEDKIEAPVDEEQVIQTWAITTGNDWRGTTTRDRLWNTLSNDSKLYWRDRAQKLKAILVG